MKHAFAAAIVRHRWLVIATTLVVTLAAGYAATKCRFNNNIAMWFRDDDSDLIVYRRFVEQFESDRLLVLGVFADDIFTPESLAALDRITRAAEELEDVHRVRSLTNARVFKGEEGTIRIAPLVKKLPRTAAECRAIRDWALGNPLLRDSLVSADGRGAAVVVELERDVRQGSRETRQGARLRDIVRRESKGSVKVAVGGAQLIDAEVARMSLRDVVRITPLSVGLIFVLVYLLFRRVTVALVPVAIVLAAITWTFGAMGALGIKLTNLTSPLNGLIVAVGVADSIHVIAEYYRRRAGGEEGRPAVIASVAHLLVPCFMTSVTTILGLLSLGVSHLKPIKEFAVFSSVGVGSAFLLSVTLLPAVMSFFRSTSPREVARQREGPMARLLDFLGRPTRRRSIATVAVTSVVVLCSVWGISRLQIGRFGIAAFEKDHPVRLQHELIDRRLGGAKALEVIITAPEDGLKDPTLLRRIDAFERWVERQPLVGSARSVVDWLKELNRVLHGGRDAHYKLPDSREAVAQYYLLFEGEDDFSKLVQRNYSVGRITVRIRAAQQAAGDFELMDKVNHKLRELGQQLGAGVKVQPTGSFRLGTTATRYMLDSVIDSLLLALVVIGAVLPLMIRSLRLTIYAMIPNVVPIAVGLGALYPMGISLNPATIMVASIALGLVVDDTVHLAFRLKKHSSAGASLNEAIYHAIQEAGRPIILTSLILIAGFMVWVLSSFVPAHDFSVATSLVILLALVGDLMLLPSILVLLRPRLGPRSAEAAERD